MFTPVKKKPLQIVDLQGFIKDIYANLTGWQRVQLSRHPERPYTLFYIDQMCKKFTELHGDRYCKDDKAIVGGIAKLDTSKCSHIGSSERHQYQNETIPKLWNGQPRWIS
jgi:acetyl-CoA carboxylase alpha subunit